MGHVVDPPLVSCPLLACHLSHTGTGGRGAEKPRRRPAGRLILTEQGRHPPPHGDKLKQAPSIASCAPACKPVCIAGRSRDAQGPRATPPTRPPRFCL